MRRTFTITPSDHFQRADIPQMLPPLTVSSVEGLNAVARHDHACAVYKDDYRLGGNFIRADVIEKDCDNDNDEPEKQMTSEKLHEMHPEIEFYAVRSRHDGLWKGSKSPRRREHYYFPIKETKSIEEYIRIQEGIDRLIPGAFDQNANGKARFLFGVENPKAVHYEGSVTIDELVGELLFEEWDDSQSKETITEGTRNSKMHKIAVRLLKRYGDCDDARNEYRTQSERCSPPLSDEELEAIWRSALGFYETIKKDKSYIPPEQYNQDDKWEKPIPLDEPNLPEFPVDCLPSSLGDYAKDIAESTQTPIDMAGVATLAITALAMQSHYKVVGKDDWEEQLSLYCLVVAEPSERKSAVFNQVLKVVHQFEAEYNDAHEEEFAKSEEEHALLANKTKKVAKDYEAGKATKEEYDEAFHRLHEHKELKPISLTLDDVTPEVLSDEMEKQGGCLAIVSSEGGLFDVINGLYSDGRSNIDIFLKSYSGDPLKVNRIKRGSVYLKEPKLTILLAVQPKVLEKLIGNENFEGRGLSARFLYSIPRTMIGSRRFETSPIGCESKERFTALIKGILQESKETTEFISLSDGAYAALKAYYEKFEQRLATDLKDISAWAGKLVGNILRISAILNRAKGIRYDEFLGDPSEDISAVWMVQKEDMDEAIVLGEYFLEHAKYAFGSMGESTALRHAKSFLEKLKSKRLESFTSRDAMRMYSCLTNRRQCDDTLTLLCDYGYLRELGTANKSSNSSIKYAVNPKIYDDDGEPP